VFLKRKNSVVRQNDITDCGPACLSCAARDHGFSLSIARIRQMAGTDKYGTSMLGMVRAAEQMGFSAKGVRGSWEALKQIPLPAVAHVVVDGTLSHFILVRKIKESGVVAMDPARGNVEYPFDEFKKIWTGVLLLLQQISFSNAEPPKKQASMPARLWAFVRPERRTLFDSIVAAILYTVLSVCTAFYLRLILDECLPEGATGLLAACGVGMLCVIIFKLIFNVFRQLLLVRIAQHLDSQLVLGYYRHLLQLPQSFFDTRFIGEIVSRLNDAVKVRFALSNAIVTVLVDGLVVAASLAAMIAYPFRLVVVSYGLLAICAGTAFLMAKPVHRTQMAMMQQGAEFQSQLVTTVQGISTVRCQTAGAYNFFQAESVFGRMLDLILKSYKQQLFVQSVSDTVSSMAVVGVLWMGGMAVMRNGLSIGELMSLYILLGYLTGPIGRMMGVQYMIQDAWSASIRLFEVMDLETEEKAHLGKIRLNADKIIGELVFENCHFRYGNRKKILSGLNVCIPAGRITMLFGQNGSGKSTLLNLLLKQYELETGRILLDGVDLRMIETKTLRSAIGVVPQHVVLFPGTVIENIAYGDVNPDIEQVISTAKQAGLEKTINEMPQQYRTLLGENGVNLSGGQRQMLACARALYRCPKILLLDEPTTYMDSESKRCLFAVIQQLREQKVTVLMITHTWDSIQHADKVVIFKEGKVAEEELPERFFKRQSNEYDNDLKKIVSHIIQ
jgi:ATP-binding cassette, subfamily C, bacteriocin exporter